MDNEKYIGLDVHQATISVAVMDCTGRIIMECILEVHLMRTPLIGTCLHKSGASQH